MRVKARSRGPRFLGSLARCTGCRLVGEKAALGAMVPWFRPARTADAPTARPPLGGVFMAAQTSGPSRSGAASANVAGGAPCPLAQEGSHSTRQRRRTSRVASTACCVRSRARAPPPLQNAAPRQSCQCQLRGQAAAATDSRREVRRTAVTTQEIACAQARSENGRRQRRLRTTPWPAIGWHDHGGRRRGSVRACDERRSFPVGGVNR